MKAYDIIKVQGKLYRLLLMSGGRAYLSGLFDLDNEVKREGVIWLMTPVLYQNELWYGDMLKWCVGIIRKIKSDGKQ